MSDSDKIHVITAAYSDGSGFEVLCALRSKEKADWLAQFIRDRNPSMSQVVVHEVTTLSRLFDQGQVP